MNKQVKSKQAKITSNPAAQAKTLRARTVRFAVLSAVTAGVIGYSNFSSLAATHVPTPGKLQATSTPRASVTSFVPMLPTSVPGYQLTKTEMVTTFRDGRTISPTYTAEYINHGQTIDVREVPGDDIGLNHGGVEGDFSWKWTPKQIGGETYYLYGEVYLGFVKNHIVYVVHNNGVAGSAESLVSFSQNLAKAPAPDLQDRTALRYGDALKNISFKPFLPTVLSSRFRVTTATSDVNKTRAGTQEVITLIYQQKDNKNKIFMVLESPLKHLLADAFSPAKGPVRTWNDSKRGLRIRVMRGLSQTPGEFQNVLNAFKMHTK